MMMWDKNAHYFLAVFPQNAIWQIITWMNENIQEKEMHEIGIGELLVFFGIMSLLTRFEFSSRHGMET
jgi:hypothetical protein